jgi:hypothetical protein
MMRFWEIQKPRDQYITGLEFSILETGLNELFQYIFSALRKDSSMEEFSGCS